jgi:hypothetical protein
MSLTGASPVTTFLAGPRLQCSDTPCGYQEHTVVFRNIHQPYPVIQCIVSPVKGSVELCGAGWLISPVSIRFEDTAKLGNLHLAPGQNIPEVIGGIEADGGQ